MRFALVLSYLLFINYISYCLALSKKNSATSNAYSLFAGLVLILNKLMPPQLTTYVNFGNDGNFQREHVEK
jgi:hypothetical protein